MAEVLIDGFHADSVATGQDGFRDAAPGTLHQFGGPFRSQRLLSALVDAALLGEGDAFALAFTDQGGPLRDFLGLGRLWPACTSHGCQLGI